MDNANKMTRYVCNTLCAVCNIPTTQVSIILTTTMLSHTETGVTIMITKVQEKEEAEKKNYKKATQLEK